MMVKMMRVQLVSLKAGSRQLTSIHPFEGTEDFCGDDLRVDDFRVDDLRADDLRSARCSRRSSLRSSLRCNERRLWAAHCSRTAGGGISAVHSPRDIAASQNCMTMLVIGRWFSTSSEIVQ
jgi:hypothetical protein